MQRVLSRKRNGDMQTSPQMCSFVALDPVLVSQTAASLEVIPIALNWFNSRAQPTLPSVTFAMALPTGLPAGRAGDACCANMAGSRWVGNTRVADCPERN
jgi:hypothetical protein